jgi:transcriptional regulator with XRE-family HTH domain
LPRADHETARQHREYYRRIMAHTGKSQTRVATEAGVSASSVSRLLKENSTVTLHARSLRKLQDYSGIALFAVDTPASATPGLAEDAVPFDAGSADPDVAAAIRALIGSRGDAGLRTISSRALEGLGYLPGDIVIVDRDRKPARGDVVCAQVDEPGRSEPETAIRIYQPPVLVAATFDEQLQRRLLWVDDPRVKIEGVVLPHRLRPTTLAG